ncbi:YcbK family protein [Proteus faecis]|uniref:Murein endopeptidase K n=1 Tax=Proteus faecis TaxID=2050967 RepID=A0AAW7CQA0_9GAMM|nr:YcbK family protein [Proteus faecis]MBG3013835.1 YcbK family protein [Proteus mirabilis]QNH66821.1 YcbK family protein [Proteus vulgaris]MCT8248113.1 YcbK family protein [Proteus faecis]MDL5165731.1 YcbK family protein [Proteus faecis]MDL5274005.1 YcbK family protein [Proteus faecis]
MDIIDSHRRKWLGLGMAAVGLGLLPSHAFASLATPRPKILRFNNLNTGETIKAEFFDGKRYNKHELAKLNHLFRDYRQNKIKTIDPALFDQIYLLQVMLNNNKPVELISGYRSLATNNNLRHSSSGVAKKSYHTRGQAMDFRLVGTELSKVRQVALRMKAGGVGYYPRSNFVHIDTGPVRSW